MKAHQRVIREKMEASDNGNLFGKYWQDLDLTLKNTEVKQIRYVTARTIIEKYEWIGTMPLPKSCRYMYGIYFDRILGGVEVYVEPSTRQFYEKYPRQVVQLNRGACAHWTPKNTASFMIAKTLRLLKAEGVKLIIAYCTQEAGEVGTIYQALGWDFVGYTAPSKVYWLDGYWMAERTLADKRAWAKSRGQRWIDKFRNLPSKKLKAKLRYVKILDDIDEIREQYNYYPQKYPHREAV